MKLSAEQLAIRGALRAAAKRFNLGRIADIIVGIGYVETRWKSGLVNNTGGDAARGGAFGPTQITEKTARQHGFMGEMQLINMSPNVAAEWTCKILMGRPGGAPQTAEDAGAWWNAGRSSADKLGPDHVTKKDYIPKLIAAVKLVQENPEA